MLSKSLLIFVFVVATMYGAYTGLRSLRRIRAPRHYANSVFTWFELPLSSFKYERANWLAMMFHSVAIGIIGVLALLQLANPAAPIVDIPTPASGLVPVIFGATGGSSAYIAILLGLTVFNPIAQRIAGKAYYALSDEGFLFGGQLIPWDSFNRYTHDPKQNVVRLWSQFSPTTVSFTLSPLPPRALPELLEALRSRMKSGEGNPASVPPAALSFPASIAIISLIGVLFSMVLYLLFGWLGIIMNALLLFFFIRVTTNLMFKFSSAGKSRPAPLHDPAA